MVRYVKGDLILMDTQNCQLVQLSRGRAQRLLLAALCCLVLAALTQAQSFSVPGTSGRNWFDTGLDIQPGTLLQLSAEGRVDVGGGWGAYGPEGTTRFANVPGYPAETRYRYGLVSRLTSGHTNPGQSVDDLYEQWSYGDTSNHQYCAARGGRLWLTVNDDNPGNNTGAFTVRVSQATCPSEVDEARIRVNLYTADNRFYRAATRFGVGDIIVLKIENNTAAAIYLRQARDPARLIREEGLQVERLEGSRWVFVLPSGRSRTMADQVIIDNGDGTATWTATGYTPATVLMDLRSTMNITRRWRALGPLAAGVYRLSLVYYGSRDTQSRSLTIYSPTFVIQ
jgi:hypothetical protein